METKPQSVAEAEAEIRDAFSQIAYPGDDRIVAKTAHLDREQKRVVAYLAGKHWSAISAKDIWRDFKGDPTTLISDLSPEAFQYYLPGFIIMCLREYHEADIMSDSLFMKFRAPDGLDRGVDEHRKRRLSKLTAAQLNATLHAFNAIEAVHVHGDNCDLDKAIVHLKTMLQG